MCISISLGIGNLGHDSEKGSLELLIFELLLPCQERETRQILYRRWDSASIRPDNRIVLDLLDQGCWSFQCLLIRCTKLIIEKRAATFRTLVRLFSNFFWARQQTAFWQQSFLGSKWQAPCVPWSIYMNDALSIAICFLPACWPGE